MTTSVHTLPISVQQHLQPADLAAALRHDVAVGLAATPKRLPPKWFYDERGSRLFDQITRLPEYYPTRAERALLERIAPEVAAVTGADTLVELGCGTSDKTRLLLAALHEAGVLRRFIPFDVDAATLTEAGLGIAAEFPGIEVHAVVGDFERHVPRLPRTGRRLVAFLGSTIGNLEPPARTALLADIAANLRPGDAFLLGTDLVKEPARLVAAYDDAAGVTAEFNRNVLLVINRELHADFDPAAFDHVALWDAEREWMEMRLRSRHHQVVRIPAINLAVPFATGEELHTEISAKFRRNGVGAELAAAGLRMIRWWTDSSGDVALSLAVPG